MGNRRVSESEIYANFRNRHEQNCLRDKLENLSEEEFNSMDLLRVEMARWRQFRRDNVRNSGWSDESMRPSKREHSVISLNSPSQRFIVTGTQTDQFQRPWAFSYKQDSHNHGYNDTFQSLLNSKPPLNLRQRSGKSSATFSSKTSTSSSTDSSSPGAQRISINQKARSKSAWTRSDIVYRSPPDTPTKSRSSWTDMNMMDEAYQQYFDIHNMAPDMTTKKLQPSRSCPLRAKSAFIKTGPEDSLRNATAKNREIILPVMVNNDQLHSKVRKVDITKSVICPECGVRNNHIVHEKRSKLNVPHNTRSTFLYHQSPPPFNEHFRDNGDIRCLCSLRTHKNDHQLHLQRQQQSQSTHTGGRVFNHNLSEGETELEYGHGSAHDNNRKSWKSVVIKRLLDVNSNQIGKQDKSKESNDFDWKSYKIPNECESPLSRDNVEIHFSRKEEQVVKVNTDLLDDKRIESKSKKRHLDPEDILASSLPLWDAELPLISDDSSENDEIHGVTPKWKSSTSNVSNDSSQESTLRKDNFKNSELKLVRRKNHVKGETSVKTNMADIAGCRIIDMAEISAQYSSPYNNLDPCYTDKLQAIESHSDAPFPIKSNDSPKQKCDEPILNGVDTNCNLKDQALPEISDLKSKQSHNEKIHRQTVAGVFSKSNDDAFTRIAKTFKEKGKENCRIRRSASCFKDNTIVTESMNTEVDKEKENIFSNNGTESIGMRTLIRLDIKIPTAENCDSVENNDNAKSSTKSSKELYSPSSMKVQESGPIEPSNKQISPTKQNPSESISQTTDKHCNETKEMNLKSKDMPHACQPLTYKRANTSVEGRSYNNNNTNNIKYNNVDKTTNKNKIQKSQIRPFNAQSRETRAYCFPDSKSDDVYHKGVLISNYICPEQRYKMDSTRPDLRCRSGNRSHSFIDARSCVVRIHFSKEARQQALTKLIEKNNSGPGKYTQKALTESLQARIKEFCISLDGYRQST